MILGWPYPLRKAPVAQSAVIVAECDGPTV
jgi:hypothetical protein